MPRAVLLALLLLTSTARADDACLARLDALGVSYLPAGRHKGMDTPVRVTGPLGGVTYARVGGQPHDLVLDCSLVYSLARAGRFFLEAGMSEARYTSAFDVRHIKGTQRPSKHSYGLALDVHEWRGSGGSLVVEDDYEQGLGEGRDCVGLPGSDEAEAMRILWCRLDRSELFRTILGPDFDEGHRNHFHVEALPWARRSDLELGLP